MPIKYLLALGLLFSSLVNASEKLTVYTYGSFNSKWGPGPKIEAAFEKKYNCDLEFINLDNGTAILNRLQLEGVDTIADVVVGLDLNLMAKAKATNLIAKHNVDTSKLVIPNGWSNPYFIPFDFGYFSFIYNSETLKNPPTSMQQLIAGNYKIIYQDPRTSTPGQGLLLWIEKLYGNNSTAIWQKLAPKTVTVTKGWSEAYNMFLNGESDLVLSYTTSPAYHIIYDKTNKYKAASFSEGHYMQVEVAAKLKTSKHQKLANKFMQFIISKDFQQEIPTGNWMYPVSEIKLPSAFKSLIAPNKVLLIDNNQIIKNRASWINTWLNAVINH